MLPNLTLRRARERRGWSQAMLARQISSTPQNVGRWERGVTRPSPHFREQLCTLFEMDAEALGLVEPVLLPHLPADPVVSPPDPSVSSSEPLIDPTCVHLAVPREHIVGRDALISTLMARLSAGTTCVLYGLPGVGKTTLAQMLTCDPAIEACFPDGLLWVSLGPSPDLHSELLRLASLLQAPEHERLQPRDVRALSHYVHQLLGKRRLLIVIDDAWSVDAAQLLLIGGPNAAHLVTTRLPEVAFALHTSSLPICVPELDTEQSWALLTSLVPQIVENSAEIVQSLLRYTGGLPLSITLLGHYLRRQIIGGQRRRIEAALARFSDVTQRLHLAVPQQLAACVPARQADIPWTLAAVIGTSDHYLPSEARQALRALSVLPAKPDSFSEAAALAVCQQGIEVLDYLLDAGLLEGASEGRYHIHQTIADYGNLHREDQAPLQRFVHYSIQFCQEHEGSLIHLEQEHSLLLAALAITAREGWLTERLQLLRHLRNLWFSRCQYDLAETMFSETLRLAQSQHNLPGQMTQFHDLGRLAATRGQYQQAVTLMSEGLFLARLHPEHINEYLLLLNGYGLANRDLGQFELAQQAYQEGLALAQQHKQLHVVAALLNNLGLLAQDHGQFRQAGILFQESLALVSSPRGICLVLQNIGECAATVGDWDEAKQAIQRAQALALTEGFEEYSCKAFYLFGMLAQNQGKEVQAQALLEEGLTNAHTLGHRLLEARILHRLALLHVRAHRLSKAEHLLNQAHTLVHATEDAPLRGRLTCIRGELLLAQRRFKMAARAFEYARTLLDWDEECRAEAEYGLARLKAAQGEYAAATDLGHQCLRRFTAMEHWQTGATGLWIEQLPTTSAPTAPVSTISAPASPICYICGKADKVYTHGVTSYGTPRFRCTHCRSTFTLKPIPTTLHHNASLLTRMRAREMAAQGQSHRQIARELGVHHTTVTRWLSVIATPPVRELQY